MYCVIRKMKNALPKNIGTNSGLSVLYHPSCRQITNDGTIVTCAGSIIVQSRMRNAADRPGQRRRANAYATNVLLNTDPSTLRPTSTSRLRAYCQNGAQ